MTLRHYVFRPRDGFRFQQGEQIIHGGYCYDVAGCVGSHFVDWHGTLFHVFDLSGLHVTPSGLYGAESLRRTPVMTHHHLHGHKHHHQDARIASITVSTNGPMVAVTPPTSEPLDLDQRWKRFQSKHRRAVMATEGVIDLAAGAGAGYEAVALVATTVAAGVTVATLSPVLITAAAVVGIYTVFRSAGSIGAGAVEILSAASQDEKHLEKTDESLERFKTLSSVSAYSTFGWQRLHHRPLDWEQAKSVSDWEGLGVGFVLSSRLPKPPEGLREVLHIQRLTQYLSPERGSVMTKAILRARAIGKAADGIDKAHVVAEKILGRLQTIREFLARQEEKRHQQTSHLQRMLQK